MLLGPNKFGRMKEWYEANERRVSTASLVFGFVFDSITLQRIDSLRENIWLGLNMAVVATCIVLLNRKTWGFRAHFWLTTVMQFAFGATLGGFFIFYFRSASLAASWPFLLLLLSAMVANEMFQKRYLKLAFQIGFLYLAILLFVIFLTPILLRSISAWAFIFSGLLSLVVVWLYLRVLRRYAWDSFYRSQKMIKRSIVGVFVVINVLYFTNIIPPIPLSLKDIGVYHSVSRDVRGNYILEAKEKSFWEYFKLRESFHATPGAPAYVYSAIFSPARLSTSIIHEWQYKDKRTDKWVTASRVPLSVSGGSDQGFRTFSIKTNLTEGLWRVNVATERGQLIGRITFRVIPVSSEPELVLRVKD